MAEGNDEKFMRRCLELASKAEGMTYPNPVVGTVIVCEGKVIGEGYHLKAGDPHAEVRAIESVREKRLLKRSTLYVSLEPCSHFGKTPPCTDLIISQKIPKVIIGTIDTSEKVSGSGISRLRNAGREVATGILEADCRWINRRFFTYHEKKRPYIILKWAQSADGYLDMARQPDSDHRPLWITGKPERVLVHRWRASEEAILVGANTIRSDRPQLNVREWTGKNPLRIILSRSGNIDPLMLNEKGAGPLIIFTRNPGTAIKGSEVALLNDMESSALQITKYLFRKGIQSLFIEGGAQVLEHFISENLWDEARIFTGITPFCNGVRAPVINDPMSRETTVFAESFLKVILNQRQADRESF